MRKFAFLLTVAILPVLSSFAQNQIILTNVRPVLFKRDGSYFVEREQIVFSRENGTATLNYRKKPNRRLKKFKQPVDLSFFLDSLDYSILDSVLTYSIAKNYSDTVEYPCECEFMNKGSLKVTLKSGEAMARKIHSYEFGHVRSCADNKYYIYMKRLEDEHRKLYKLIFDK